jgi:hypothetical protein
VSDGASTPTTDAGGASTYTPSDSTSTASGRVSKEPALAAVEYVRTP